MKKDRVHVERVCNTGVEQSRKPCITVQPARLGAKLSNIKLPLGKDIDVQDTGKSSDPVVTGLHIESQVGKAHNILSSKPL